MTAIDRRPAESPLFDAPSSGLRVLHVTEAMGGGITTSLEGFVESTPEHEHGLLFAPRSAHDTGQQPSQMFAWVRRSDGGVLALRRAITAAVREFGADLVHLHSSWAGVVGRLVRLPVPLVYSPHCFWFEHTDRSAPVCAAARGVEQLLGRRADVVVCVSPHEQHLAQRLGMAAVYVPNRPKITPQHPVGAAESSAPIVTIGRVCAQKDPEFFAQTVEALLAMLPDTRRRVMWLGDGDAGSVQRLRAAGVEVTGWLPRDEVLRQLSGAALYLHSAAWEGNPMSLLEAAALGVPVVARSVAGLVSLDYPDQLTTPGRLAVRAVQVLAGHGTPSAGYRPVSVVEQGTALNAAYDYAAARGVRR